MSERSRPLEVRLREYVSFGRQTAAQLVNIADEMDARFPMESQTTELRATATVQKVVCDDLEKMLNGEELKGWKIEGRLPDGGL